MEVIRVGAFELSPSERTLSCAGRRIELGARAFDLMLVLVEQPGRLVSKATLLERVWPKLVVDENNLPAQIASLRRALGAGAIRTVPGFGYRLELEVAAMPAASFSAVAANPPALAPAETVPPVPLRRVWPERLGPLIGREADLSALEQTLARSRLVTIVGMAGVGKSRLAQEVLMRGDVHATAVAWVALGSVGDVELVPSAIALALGLSLPENLPGFVALRQALEDMAVLLVLDCAEHLASLLAAPLEQLIAQTRALRVLVTSQLPLGICGETVYRLAVLAVPERDAPLEEAAGHGAVALFAELVAAADQRFERTSSNTALMVEICRRLDGIPLALELAAARAPALGLSALLERLDDRFRLLKLASRPHEARHGALHTALDWSYSLLSEAEQRVFNRLGAFSGSFSLQIGARCVADEQIDSAEAIDLIGRLVDRSLVVTAASEPPRYALLETARVYARARLKAAGELESAYARMAVTMLALLDEAYQAYWSLDEAIWLHRYQPDLDNVRTAMEWALQHDSALGVALFGSAWPLFVETELYAEARARHAQALTLLSDTLPRARLGRFWEAVATYESTRRWDRARYAAELAAEMHAAVADPRARYYALLQLALNWRDADAARSALARARALEDPAWPSRLLAYGELTEGALLMSAGQFIEARSAYQRAVRHALSTSERQALTATVSVVELDLACGQIADALRLAEPLAVGLQQRGLYRSLIELRVLMFSGLLLAGQLEQARPCGAELCRIALRFDAGRLYSALDAMAYLASLENRCATTADIARYADLAHEQHGQRRRRPSEQRLRAATHAYLERQLGSAWREAGAGKSHLDEASACALALGMTIF